MTEQNERKVRSYKKSKNKKKSSEFSVTEEGITEVVGTFMSGIYEYAQSGAAG